MSTSKNTKKTAAAAKPKKAAAKPNAKPTGRLLHETHALRAEYAAAKAALDKLRAAGSASFDALWEEVDHILSSEPPLYLGGGYRSAADFVRKELPGESMRDVARNCLVARCFTPRDETAHGINFLEEVALYAKELAGSSQAPRAIDLDRLRVRFREGDGIRTLAARSAVIDQVRKARRLLAGRRGGGSKKPASAVETALRAALSKRPSLRSVAVRATDKEASFGAVPVSALKDLGGVLSAFKARPPR